MRSAHTVSLARPDSERSISLAWVAYAWSSSLTRSSDNLHVSVTLKVHSPHMLAVQRQAKMKSTSTQLPVVREVHHHWRRAIVSRRSSASHKNLVVGSQECKPPRMLDQEAAACSQITYNTISIAGTQAHMSPRNNEF